MKFGKVFRQTTETRMPQWRDHMMGYKALKQAIKQQLAQVWSVVSMRSTERLGSMVRAVSVVNVLSVLKYEKYEKYGEALKQQLSQVLSVVSMRSMKSMVRRSSSSSRR